MVELWLVTAKAPTEGPPAKNDSSLTERWELHRPSDVKPGSWACDPAQSWYLTHLLLKLP